MNPYILAILGVTLWAALMVILWALHRAAQEQLRAEEKALHEWRPRKGER